MCDYNVTMYICEAFQVGSELLKQKKKNGSSHLGNNVIHEDKKRTKD